MSEDYYKILCVDPIASQKEIELAADRLYSIWSKRRGISSLRRSDILSQIRKAKEVLTDPFERHEYDVKQGFKINFRQKTPVQDFIPLKFSESIEALETVKIPGKLDYEKLEKSTGAIETLTDIKVLSDIKPYTESEPAFHCAKDQIIPNGGKKETFDQDVQNLPLADLKFIRTSSDTNSIQKQNDLNYLTHNTNISKENESKLSKPLKKYTSDFFSSNNIKNSIQIVNEKEGKRTARNDAGEVKSETSLHEKKHIKQDYLNEGNLKFNKENIKSSSSKEYMPFEDKILPNISRDKTVHGVSKNKEVNENVSDELNLDLKTTKNPLKSANICSPDNNKDTKLAKKLFSSDNGLEIKHVDSFKIIKKSLLERKANLCSSKVLDNDTSIERNLPVSSENLKNQAKESKRLIRLKDKISVIPSGSEDALSIRYESYPMNDEVSDLNNISTPENSKETGIHLNEQDDLQKDLKIKSLYSNFNQDFPKENIKASDNQSNEKAANEWVVKLKHVDSYELIKEMFLRPKLEAYTRSKFLNKSNRKLSLPMPKEIEDNFPVKRKTSVKLSEDVTIIPCKRQGLSKTSSEEIRSTITLGQKPPHSYLNQHFPKENLEDSNFQSNQNNKIENGMKIKLVDSLKIIKKSLLERKANLCSNKVLNNDTSIERSLPVSSENLKNQAKESKRLVRLKDKISVIPSGSEDALSIRYKSYPINDEVSDLNNISIPEDSKETGIDLNEQDDLQKDLKIKSLYSNFNQDFPKENIKASDNQSNEKAANEWVVKLKHVDSYELIKEMFLRPKLEAYTRSKFLNKSNRKLSLPAPKEIEDNFPVKRKTSVKLSEDVMIIPWKIKTSSEEIRSTITLGQKPSHSYLNQHFPTENLEDSNFQSNQNNKIENGMKIKHIDSYELIKDMFSRRNTEPDMRINSASSHRNRSFSTPGKIEENFPVKEKQYVRLNESVTIIPHEEETAKTKNRKSPPSNANLKEGEDSSDSNLNQNYNTEVGKTFDFSQTVNAKNFETYNFLNKSFIHNSAASKSNNSPHDTDKLKIKSKIIRTRKKDAKVSDALENDSAEKDFKKQLPQKISEREKNTTIKDSRVSMLTDTKNSSQPIESVSATTRIFGTDVKTVYSFGSDTDLIEVFVNDELKVRIVKDEKQDVYSNEMKHDDLPPGVSIFASTVIAANNAIITTEVARRDNRESIAVYKNDNLLCRTGCTILDNKE